jgi:S1-C subfamily serine protease
MTDKINFNSKNPETVEFLKRIGLEESQIQKGSITEGEALQTDLQWSSLLNLATSEPAPKEASRDEFLDSIGGRVEKSAGNIHTVATLSPNEASRALKLIAFYGPQKVLGLFKNHCLESSDILNNLLEINSNTRLFGMVLPAQCSFDPNLTAMQALGVYYGNNQVPSLVAKAAKAVVQIILPGDHGGSAVLVSSEGDLLTAQHVLRDIKGKFREGGVIQIGDKTFPISEKDIIKEDTSRDLVKIRLSDLKGLSYLKPGKQPTGGEEVWATGFPGQPVDRIEELEKLSTLGVVNPAQQPGSPFLALKMRVAEGNSGGSLLNSRGELVGIIHSIGMRGMINTALHQPEFSEASLLPEGWL